MISFPPHPFWGFRAVAATKTLWNSYWRTFAADSTTEIEFFQRAARVFIQSGIIKGLNKP
jgi:hypothetical protein